MGIPDRRSAFQDGTNHGFILDEVCLGLRYLHSRNPPIIHRDITPNNILLGVHLEAKITDLGVAKVVKSDNQKSMTYRC